MTDAQVLAFIRTDATHGATCRALADAGQDSAVAQIVSTFAPLVTVPVRFTDLHLAQLFGMTRAVAIVTWLQANNPTLLGWMQREGVDLSHPETPADLAHLVAAGAITTDESASILGLAQSPDTIDHLQVTRVLNPLRTTDAGGSVRAAPIKWS